MARYQRMYLATVTVNLPSGPQTVIGVSHFEQGASTHIAESVENLGFTPKQVGRILDRVRVSEMRADSLGCVLTLPGELHHVFGRLA